MQYRKDIQILRGVAVLLVVFFHLGFTGFASGFLGVDVFFVISGFLMAVMYDPARKYEFFEKRAKRLLPAYFAVVLATLIAAAVVTTPNEYPQVSEQGIFAIFFASNIGFWLENSYFDKAAFKPLLHLWSLGVEIQFYLFVPIIYWFFKKFNANYFFALAGSAGFCFLMIYISPKTSFFWMPFRLWQFLMGYGVATYLAKWRSHPDTRLTLIGAVSFLLIVCIPLFPVDGSALGFMNGHPGLMSVLISSATATTLIFGIPFRIEKNVLSTLLEKLGKYSYSIYLVHFPIVVLFLYKPFYGTNIKPENIFQIIILVFLICGASTILYVFVERPFRHKQKLLIWGLLSVFAISLMIPAGQQLQKTITPEKEMLVYEAWGDRSPYRCGKIIRIINPNAKFCDLTPNISAPSYRILLVGNSHADSIKKSFTSVAQEKNIGVSFVVDNLPLMAEGMMPQALIKEAKNLRVDMIVLHYLSKSIILDNLKYLIELANKENIRVSLILPVPVWSEKVPIMILDSYHNQKSLPIQSIEAYQTENIDLINSSNKMFGLNIYSVAQVLCEAGCKLISNEGRPLYFDTNHLTITGSEMLHDVFERVVSEMIVAKDTVRSR